MCIRDRDYSDFLRFHKEKGAEFSVAVMEVPWDEASRFGLMVADEDSRITEFQEDVYKRQNTSSILIVEGRFPKTSTLFPVLTASARSCVTKMAVFLFVRIISQMSLQTVSLVW